MNLLFKHCMQVGVLLAVMLFVVGHFLLGDAVISMLLAFVTALGFSLSTFFILSRIALARSSEFPAPVLRNGEVVRLRETLIKSHFLQYYR